MRVAVSVYAPNGDPGGLRGSFYYDTVTLHLYRGPTTKKPLPYNEVLNIGSVSFQGVVYSKLSSGNLFQPAKFGRTQTSGPIRQVPASSWDTGATLGGILPDFTNTVASRNRLNYGIDPLDEYLDPTPSMQTQDDFLEEFANDWEALDRMGTDAAPPPAVTVALAHTHHLYNSPYGFLTIEPRDGQERFVGRDFIPVYHMRAVLQQQVNVRYHDPTEVIDFIFRRAYTEVLNLYAQRGPDANDYAQIRLLRPDGADSFFDVTSDLTPYYETVDDFLIAFELLLQSETNRTERRAGGFLAEMLEMEFSITFVLVNPGQETAAVTVDNLAEIRNIASSFASNNVQRRPTSNFTVTRNRWVQQQNLGVDSRVNARRSGMSNSQILELRRKADREARKRKPTAPAADSDDDMTPAELAAKNRREAKTPRKKRAKGDEPEPKRAYNRRSKDELRAIRALGPAVGDLANYSVIDGVVVKTGRQRSNNWTEEERAEQNRIRRQKYKEGKQVRGVYEDLKKRIFHHASIEQFYQHSKSVLQVPNTWKEGYCLAMAFIKSECRTYVVESGQVRETQPYAFQPEVGEYAVAPILDSFSHLIDQDCDFITGENILLFNPYKYPCDESDDPAVKYCLRPPDNVIQKWYQSAQNLHLFVSEEVGMELDENSESALQAYADVFDVHIALYNLEVRGKRTVVIKPRSAPHDLRKTDQFRVVSLLISDEHCSAITNLRAFLKNNTNANRTSIHNYCVFCEKCTTSNNQTAAEAVAHWSVCLEKKRGELCCDSDKKNRAQCLRNIHPPQFLYDSKSRCYKCRLCSEALETGVQLGQVHHVCYMEKDKKPKVGDGSQVYVYDFECEQVRQGSSRNFIHKVNLVCVRRIYADASGDCDRHCFATLEQFMTYVMSHSGSNRVYLAHNGSKYDVQFIVKHLEKNMIPHQFVPAPSSMHAYLSVSLNFGAKTGATFLDFRHFMPGSLKNIAISFGLSLQKGDFPHHFNNGSNEFYEGRIPLLDHPDDYWCLLSKKTEEEVTEFREWYASQEKVYCTCDAECVCGRKKWSFQEEIIKYCWLDVDVLAEASSRYRDWAMAFGEGEDAVEGWTAKPVDPFQYLTIPQLAMTTLMSGLPEEENITITPYKMRTDRVPLAIAWMERLQSQHDMNIRHIGNWHKEFFEPKTQRYVDGVTDDMKIFVCLSCSFHACPFCFYEEGQTGVDHPTRPATYGAVCRDTSKYLEDLMKTYGPANTFIVWEHELSGYTAYEHELGKVMVDREMFKGGRTEVFSPFCNAEMYPEDDIRYFDVCSLYPFVCAFTELPTGQPEHYCGREIEMSRLVSEGEDRYSGYVRCTVIPNAQDRIGLLPCHDAKSGRLEFPLREMTGSWGTEELRLAYQNGYVIKDVFEVYHWPRAERSDTFMRGYVSFFLRMKQEAEGWRKLGASSDDPPEDEKRKLVETVFEENGRIGRIRPELVRKNPINRALAKTFLNSLWGKFCQRAHTDHYSTIHGYAEFAQLWNDPHLDRRKVSFRHLSHGTWKVKYHLFSDFAKENPRYNIFVAAKVTESARCILHRQMLKIGPERILYCDTDSIMFLWPKTGEKLDAHGLGKWVDEYPRQRIKRLYALAPKFYYLEFEDDALLKSKGIMMNHTNRALLHGKSLGKQLLELMYPRTDDQDRKLPFQGFIPMRNMLMGIHTTSTEFEYGTMLTKETNDKKLQPVLTKRHLVPYLKERNVAYDTETGLDKIARMYTIPKGYYLSVEQMSALCYI